ncbi:hypothetical protein ACLPHM_04250 [Paenalcaligenes sp. Me131]|uniref:hypothetical protein n=1 Tax=Paenalcaligenes sp. Me131 TaxID=3392636 RepID=UPI003D2D3066
MENLNKMTSPPPSNSRDIKAYWHAILEISGLLVGEDFDVTLFMGNYRTHIESGRLLKTENGFKLSENGHRYFCQRLHDKKVSRQEVIAMMRKILSPTPPLGWEQITIP